MHITEVLKKPVLTEKSFAGHKDNVYTFLVDKKANKVQIKKTFEEIFEVKVESVRTVNYDAKEKRLGKYVGKKPSYKKAIITLKEGQKLDVLSDL
ncbi:50S ribosomal protein L23 [Mycoplasma mycoides]|uniref:Large ribosomal subunit protein uL23 n=2 Tax=Mycoplasma mycoides subsp. capri TaxID=40477 RepID=F4MQP0_MYCML|nr:50S ribosomal protein L23 [Mycoplasma mycoides]ADH21593.1 ribosomal protein L23 [synthetic Mycoplasma mycoides JCVI-syn1.0]AMW76618.1 L23: ribosomal protein L23 [synthetic bacterium JCVI-Syn3.0]AMW77090.1 L23: ribosomal protein L23 [synthetic bacterium JCVI-Syn2.0]AVX54918.1 50S ribosomal protein L23 [synthetic bacterium JCVI-Syn3A]QWN46154.1 50S ribosomal protein L23 [synthetic bacterium JCVI-Syn3B]